MSAAAPPLTDLPPVTPAAASLPPAQLPPALPGLDPAWSRLVTARDTEGVERTWHVLDNGADPVVGTMFCVHGNPTWSYLWRRFLDQAPPGWRVVAVDQLGMGFSERTARPRTLAQRVADLTVLSDALGITGAGVHGPVVSVGHDWGGPISLGWALEHRARFLLLYGTPVPGFAPGPGAGEAAARLAAPFVEAVFDGWTDAELAAVPLQPGAETVGTVDQGVIALPPGALAYFFEQRARMHGLVTLELLGHLHPLQEHAGALFTGAMRRAYEESEALRAGLPVQPRSSR